MRFWIAATLFLLAATNTLANGAKSPAQTDVVVVGGGLAGLAALEELLLQGYKNVRLFESNDRVGGKVWTETGTPLYERGAELVNSSDDTLIQTMRRHGVRLVERKFVRERREDAYVFRERKWIDGRLEIGELRVYEMHELVELMKKNPADIAALKKIIELSQNPRAMGRDISEIYASDVVKGSDLVRALAEAVMRSEMGLPLRQVGAELLLDCMSVDPKTLEIDLLPGTDERFRIRGGSETLVRAMSKPLESHIHKDSTLTDIRQLPSGRFEMKFAHSGGMRSTIQSDLVVMAVPANVLAEVNFQVPGISHREIVDASRMPFAKNAKVFLVFDERFWEKANVKGPTFRGTGVLESGVQFWETTEDQKSRKAVITLYPGDWPEDPAEAHRRLKEIISEMKRIPQLKSLDRHLVKVDHQVWRQSYAGAFNPGYPEAPALFREPRNGLVFIGSDKDISKDGTIHKTFGYMDGAVHSAVSGVHRLVLSKGHTPRFRCEAVFSSDVSM